MEYKEKNRNIQNEFLVKLNNVFEAFDNADNLLDEVNNYLNNDFRENTSNTDLLESDLIHILENHELNDDIILNVGKKLEETLQTRRNWHNINEISMVWLKNYKKLYNRQEREFFKNSISSVVRNLDKPYNYRVLSEDDINNLMNSKKEKHIESTTRKKYLKLTNEEKQEVKNELANGIAISEIVKKYNISRSQAYILKNEL